MEKWSLSLSRSSRTESGIQMFKSVSLACLEGVNSLRDHISFSSEERTKKTFNLFITANVSTLVLITRKTVDLNKF